MMSKRKLLTKDTLLVLWTALFFGICLLVLALPASALGLFGYSPRDYKSNLTFGEGVYFAPYDTKIYAEPREDAPLVEEVLWTHNTQSLSVLSKLHNQNLPANHFFLSFFPGQDVAMMAVVSENGENWAEVVYDQARKKTGWVKLREAEATQPRLETETPLVKATANNFKETPQPTHFERFQTWLDFMSLNAKRNGFYWLSGVSEYHRSLRSAPEDKAKLIPITVMRDIKLKHIRGNWMLVEVVDFERNTPIGWIRWRDDDGNLMVFTNFSGQKPPIVSGYY